MTPDTVRQSDAYKVMTPDEVVAMAHELGDHSSLYLTPLFGGIAPEKGWKMLQLFEREVLPHWPRGCVKPRWGMPETQAVE